MAPGHIPAFLFATLIVSFCYGEFDIYPDGNVLNIYIRNCRYTLYQSCWHHIAQAKIYWQNKSTVRATLSFNFYSRDCGEFGVLSEV